MLPSATARGVGVPQAERIVLGMKMSGTIYCRDGGMEKNDGLVKIYKMATGIS